MEIATLVCNNGLNYDLVFQTFSMSEYLKRQGNQVQVIDYNFLKKDNKKSEMLYSFLVNNVVLTFNRYNDVNQLEENLPLADKFIVLNGEYNELSLQMNGNKNIAYGIKTNLSEINNISDNFFKVSTFYDSKNEKINRVIDPIFLLKKEEWYDIINEETVNMPIDYILIYSDNVTKEMLSYASKISENSNSKIYIVADKVEGVFYKGKRLKNVEPFELLKLISNAQDVITSCNDGIKFAVLFEKNLHIFSNEDENQIELINDFNLRRMVVSEPNKIVSSNIGYNDSYKEIDRLLENSEEFLKA
jgi:hypothetical protein